MEVGRLGVKFGIEPPTLIKLEMSLEEPLPPPAKGASTLDEKVLHEGSCSSSTNGIFSLDNSLEKSYLLVLIL